MIKDWKTMRDMALDMAKGGIIPVFGDFCQELEEIVAECIFLVQKQGFKKATLIISSNGGQMDSFATIRGAMSLSGIEFTGIVAGKARSNGFMLLQLCAVRKAYRGSSIMFHWGHYRLENADIAALWNGETWPVDHILQSRREMLTFVHRRTGILEKLLLQYALAERDFTAEEALSMHLIDEIVDDLPVKLPEVEIEPDQKPRRVRGRR